MTLLHTGTATVAAGDYTVGALTLTVDPSSVSEPSGTATLEVIDDAVYEGTQEIRIQAAKTGYKISPVLKIPLEDDEQKLRLAVSPAQVSEPSGTARVTVSVANAIEADAVVTLTHPGSGTAASNDYRLAQTVTIPAGGTSVTTTLTAVDNEEDEPDKTVLIQAGASGYGSTLTRTVIIIDDDESQLGLSVSPSVSEAGGTSTVTVAVPSWAAPSADTTVALTHPGSGSAESSDYTLARTVTIPANQTSVTATLQAVGDAIYEKNETILIQAGAAGYDSSPTRTVTIEDDESEPDPGLAVSSASVSEPSGTATVTATLTVAAEGATTFTFTHPGTGTATRNTDYTLAGAVTIPEGSKSAETTLRVKDDVRYEVDETVRISASTRFGNTPTRTVTIEDNDRQLRLSVGPSTISEPNGAATLTVSAPPGGDRFRGLDGHPHPSGGDRPRARITRWLRR